MVGGKECAVWKAENLRFMDSAVQEATAAFGNGGMYMENSLKNQDISEIQIAGDQYGKACHLSERDYSCSEKKSKTNRRNSISIL